MTEIPWYAYLIILFLPCLINTLIGIYIQLYLKRINRQEKNPPWTYKKSLVSAIMIGAPMGALTQILLQSVLSPYIHMDGDSQWHLVIFCAVFCPWLIMFGYSMSLWYTKKKGYVLLYEYLRVRHLKLEYPDEDSDFTVQGYHDNNDIREE
jgi:hypothetical protein